MGINLLAFLWGLSEASFFFLVPDILLSLVVVTPGLRKALTACMYVMAGALVGGTILYYWGKYDPVAVRDFLVKIPAIQQPMLNQVETSLQQQGVSALLHGPLNGIPYKTYAAQMYANGVGLVPFLLVSVPARLVRFVAVSLFTYVVCRFVLKDVTVSTRYLTALAVWLVFYIVYFSVMGI